MSLVVNFFAGPGAGKSTLRAGTFAALKARGVNVEEVTEYAKDLTWEGRGFALSFQPYILAKQWRNIERLYGKVDVILVDSPLLLSYVYADRTVGLRGRTSEHIKMLSLSAFRSYDNLNFFVERMKPYAPVGRSQTEEEAHQLDEIVRGVVRLFGGTFTSVPGNDVGRDVVVDRILKEINHSP